MNNACSVRFPLFQQIGKALAEGYGLARPKDEGVNGGGNKDFCAEEEIDILDVVCEKVGEGHCEGGNQREGRDVFQRGKVG